MSHSDKVDLSDEVFFEAKPRFRAASLGKLGEALKKHILEFPDVLSLSERIESKATSGSGFISQREDL